MSMLGWILVLVGGGLLLLAAYYGSNIVTAITSVVNAIFQAVGRILTLAPRGLQVGVFLIIGGFALTLIVNWVVALNTVCVDGVPYTGDAFSVAAVKVLPSGALTDGSSSTHSAVASLLPNTAFASTTGADKFGTLLSVAGDPQVTTPFSPNDLGRRILAWPVYKDPEAMTTDVAGSKTGLAKQKIGDLYICRVPTPEEYGAWSFAAPGGNIQGVPAEAGHCYLTESVGWPLPTKCGFYQQMAAITITTLTSNDVTKLSIKYAKNPNRNLSSCVGGGTNTTFLIPDADALFEGAGIEPGGQVHAKYIFLDDHRTGIKQITSSASSNARKDAVEFLGLNQSANSGQFLSSACSAEDDVVVGIFGIPLVWETVIVVAVLFGMLGVIRWMGII